MPDTRATLLASSGKVTPSEVLPHSTTTRLNSRHRTNAQFAEAWSEAEADWLQKLSYQLGQLRDAHMHTQHQRHQLVNKHATAPVYQVGDMVVLRDIHRPPGVEGKLRRPYLGPWQITDVHANHTLSLSDLDGNMLPRRIPFLSCSIVENIKLLIRELNVKGGECYHTGNMQLMDSAGPAKLCYFSWHSYVVLV